MLRRSWTSLHLIYWMVRETSSTFQTFCSVAEDQTSKNSLPHSSSQWWKLFLCLYCTKAKKGCPWVGFESTTLCSLGECSTNWATGVVEVRCTLVVFFSVIICKTNVCLFVCSSIEMATVPLWSKSFLALKMSLPLTPGIYTHIIYIHYHVLHQAPWIITSPMESPTEYC